MWIKVRSLVGSLADGVLADTILIPPRPPIPVTDLNIQNGVSGIHVVYGQQNNNMSTHTILSTRANKLLFITKTIISSLLMSSDLHLHYHDDLAVHQFWIRLWGYILWHYFCMLTVRDINGLYLDRLSYPRMELNRFAFLHVSIINAHLYP